jgi:hypothetical protein
MSPGETGEQGENFEKEIASVRVDERAWIDE